MQVERIQMQSKCCIVLCRAAGIRGVRGAVCGNRQRSVSAGGLLHCRDPKAQFTACIASGSELALVFQ